MGADRGSFCSGATSTTNRGQTLSVSAENPDQNLNHNHSQVQSIQNFNQELNKAGHYN